MDLAGKHVVITGASRGLGAALADQFAAKGATLTLVARSVSGLEEVAGRTGARVHPADLSDAAQVDGLIGRIEAEGGPVDVLVNNAGIDLTGAFIDMPMADSVLSYAPTKASFKRFALLLPDTDVHTLAVKTVRAVEKNKRSVRMPARAFLFPVLTNLPRRMAEMLLAGVPRREK